jgi:hypothetical protein
MINGVVSGADTFVRVMEICSSVVSRLTDWLELTPKETHERQQRSKPLYKNLQWRFFQVKKRLQSKANSQLLSTEPLQPYSKKVRNEIEKGPLLFSMPNAEESNIPAL